MSRHRVTTSTGAVVDAPTVVELGALVAEVARSGRDAFLIVERRAGAGGSSLLARRAREGWALELHDGGPSRQYLTRTMAAGAVQSAVTYWVLRGRAWPGLTWQHRSEAALAHDALAAAV